MYDSANSHLNVDLVDKSNISQYIYFGDEPILNWYRFFNNNTDDAKIMVFPSNFLNKSDELIIHKEYGYCGYISSLADFLHNNEIDVVTRILEHGRDTYIHIFNIIDKYCKGVLSYVYVNGPEDELNEINSYVFSSIISDHQLLYYITDTEGSLYSNLKPRFVYSKTSVLKIYVDNTKSFSKGHIFGNLLHIDKNSKYTIGFSSTNLNYIKPNYNFDTTDLTLTYNTPHTNLKIQHATKIRNIKIIYDNNEENTHNKLVYYSEYNNNKTYNYIDSPLSNSNIKSVNGVNSTSDCYRSYVKVN